MKLLLILISLVPTFLSAQTHQRYEITIPADVTGPYVAEILVPLRGKVVSLSEGGNFERNSGRVSWAILNDTVSSVWMEMIFPEGVTSSLSGNLILTFANGSIRSLQSTASSIPNSALALLAGEDMALDLSTDQDKDGLPLLLERMLGLSDESANNTMEAFSVISEASGKKLTASLSLFEGYDLLIRPALGTAPGLSSVLLASDYQSADGSLLEIPDLPDKLIFTISVISPE